MALVSKTPGLPASNSVAQGGRRLKPSGRLVCILSKR